MKKWTTLTSLNVSCNQWWGYKIKSSCDFKPVLITYIVAIFITILPRSIDISASLQSQNKIASGKSPLLVQNYGPGDILASILFSVHFVNESWILQPYPSFLSMYTHKGDAVQALKTCTPRLFVILATWSKNLSKDQILFGSHSNRPASKGVVSILAPLQEW